MTINETTGMIYGDNGSASYYTNDSGGIELQDVDGEITDSELAEAQASL